MTSNYLTASRARHVTFPSVSYRAMGCSILSLHYWASEASPTLGCSIEISRGMSVGMYVCMSVVVQKA